MKRHFSLQRFYQFIVQVFFAVGVLWTATEVLAFFSSEAGEWIRGQWWVFGAVAIVWAVVRSHPRGRFAARLNGRDVTIELVAGDIFAQKGMIVVPTNNAFDAALLGRVARASSIQGKLLREFYRGKAEHLQADIDGELEGENRSGEPDGRVYDIGKAVFLRHDGRKFCLLATTRLNEHGAAWATIDDLHDALAGLWWCLGNKGEKDAVVIPALGTGHGRLPLARDIVVRTIIRSFVASCSERAYCDRLIIALHPKDLKKHDIDLEELGSFLQFSCRYTQFNKGGPAKGTATE